MVNEKNSKIKTSSTVYISLFIIGVFAVAGILGVLGYSSSEFTGFGASLATIRMNMSPTLDITLTDANITFGGGAVYANSSFAIVDSTPAVCINGTWANVNDPFYLENTGNVFANVSINASKTALGWLGGTQPAFWFNWTNNKTPPNAACLLDGNDTVPAPNNASWIMFSNATTATIGRTNICQKLNFTDTTDALRIDLRVKIPADAGNGTLTNQFTFSATASEGM